MKEFTVNLNNKYNNIKNYLKELKGSAGVAFSGGVDSSLLLKLAKDSCEEVTGIFMDSVFIDKNELFFAKQIAFEINANLEIISWNPLSFNDITENSDKRCYFCKKEIYNMIKKFSYQSGINHIIDGSNLDDVNKGYKGRPGLMALKEHNILKPLAETYFTKSDVRELAKSLGLSNYLKESKSCKAALLPKGKAITIEALAYSFLNINLD
jgi:uncharacterized protein